MNYFIDLKSSTTVFQVEDNQSLNLTEITTGENIFVIEGNEYCSQLFDAQGGMSQLLSAATPLFAIAFRISKAKDFSTFNKKILFSCLSQEIKVFTNKLKEANYPQNVISAASYALCAFTDEIIGTSNFGKAQNWQNTNLLSFFHGKNQGADYFFTLLDQAYQDPAIYIDLLELMYLCLQLGFMGKYRALKDGTSSLNSISRMLYNCILKQRGEFNKKLFIPDETITPKENNTIKTPLDSISKTLSPITCKIIKGIIIAFSLVTVILVYTVFKNNFTEVKNMLPAGTSNSSPIVDPNDQIEQ